MGRIKSEIYNMKNSDLWSFILFILFKLKDSDKYSALSELSFILDKENMLKFIEYFGGMDIHVPTSLELELVISSIIAYFEVTINNKNLEEILDSLDTSLNKASIKKCYCDICNIMNQYEFNLRGLNADI